MCGRYTLVRGDKIIEVIPNVTIPANLRLVARYNLAPSQLAPVVTNDSSQLQLLHWGLIPPWAKDPSVGYKMINARAETLAAKPAFRKALTRQRCLIPADGFYEWKLRPGSKTKIPMYIRMRTGQLFAFAGLWESWKGPDGHELRSFTIITTPPNELLKPIHDRMPAILQPDAYHTWLTPGELSADQAQACLQPFPADAMEAFPVRTLVNSPHNESPDLITPAPAPPTPTPETEPDAPPKKKAAQQELFP